jgi:hypothetical protein
MWEVIKYLNLCLVISVLILVMLDIKAELETIETQQYIQTLTLKQLVGCVNVAED